MGDIMMKQRQSRGVTLIELMVVVVIVAILAGVAYPSYRQYAIRSNRTEAKTALLQLTQTLEKCYTRFHDYTHEDCDLDAPELTNYTIDLDAIAADTYTLVAIPKGGQVDDKKCGNLTLDQAGKKDIIEGTGTPKDCW